MIIETRISYGHKALIETFLDANNLYVRVKKRPAFPVDKITLDYEDNSDTAINLTYMGMVHAGIENMLDDYLIRCGVRPDLISNFTSKREMTEEELEEEWQKHKKKLGI